MRGDDFRLGALALLLMLCSVVSAQKAGSFTVGDKTPYLLVIDLGSEQTVTALEYLPRAEQDAPGSIKDFKIFLW